MHVYLLFRGDNPEAYTTMSAVARSIGCKPQSIRNALNKSNPCKLRGNTRLYKVPLYKDDLRGQSKHQRFTPKNSTLI